MLIATGLIALIIFIILRTRAYKRTPYKIVEMKSGKFRVKEPNWFFGSSWAGPIWSPDHINYIFEWGSISGAEKYIELCREDEPVREVKRIANN